MQTLLSYWMGVESSALMWNKKSIAKAATAKLGFPDENAGGRLEISIRNLDELSVHQLLAEDITRSE